VVSSFEQHNENFGSLGGGAGSCLANFTVSFSRTLLCGVCWLVVH
jgi:hypothetical protein